MEQHKAEKSKETTPTSSESKGVLGSVWSAAGAMAGAVQNAVQGMFKHFFITENHQS